MTTGEKQYDRNTFNIWLESELEQITKLLSTKGTDYSGNDDVLANFRRNSDIVALKESTVLYIHLSKHLDAITNFIKCSAKNRVYSASEPIGSRIDDAIAYLLLLKFMIR